MRTKCCVVANSPCRDGDNRDQTGLAALACDTQYWWQWVVCTGQGKGFRDPQPEAVKEAQDRSIAGRDPVFAGIIADSGQDGGSAVFAEGARELTADLGAASREDGAGVGPGAVGGPGGKALHGRKRPCDRAGGKAARPFLGHPSAEIGLRSGGDACQPFRPAAVQHKEGQVTRNIAAIGLDRVGSGALQCGKLRQPLGQRRAESRCENGGQASQRRIRRSKTPAKKARRSVPCKDLN